MQAHQMKYSANVRAAYVQKDTLSRKLRLLSLCVAVSVCLSPRVCLSVLSVC